MKLIPFALKDSAKCWMYGLAANCVASWNDFVQLFLRKYFPNAKIVKLRNEINQFVNSIGNHFRNILIGSKIYWPSVPIMV